MHGIMIVSGHNNEFEAARVADKSRLFFQAFAFGFGGAERSLKAREGKKAGFDYARKRMRCISGDAGIVRLLQVRRPREAAKRLFSLVGDSVG